MRAITHRRAHLGAFADDCRAWCERDGSDGKHGDRNRHGRNGCAPPGEETFAATLRGHDAKGEIYNLSYPRTAITVTRYTDDAILANIEAWADTAPALDGAPLPLVPQLDVDQCRRIWSGPPDQRGPRVGTSPTPYFSEDLNPIHGVSPTALLLDSSLTHPDPDGSDLRAGRHGAGQWPKQMPVGPWRNFRRPSARSNRDPVRAVSTG